MDYQFYPTPAGLGAKLAGMLEMPGDHKIQGEFFNITFDEACAELKKHEDITDTKNF